MLARIHEDTKILTILKITTQFTSTHISYNVSSGKSSQLIAYGNIMKQMLRNRPPAAHGFS